MPSVVKLENTQGWKKCRTSNTVLGSYYIEGLNTVLGSYCIEGLNTVLGCYCIEGAAIETWLLLKKGSLMRYLAGIVQKGLQYGTIVQKGHL
jgi:hypothetical protein